jgi:hypothetical protein
MSNAKPELNGDIEMMYPAKPGTLKVPGSQSLMATCQCGAVALEAADEPILTVVCCCTSCQTAGRQFEGLPGAPKVLDSYGGTPLTLYRKDRVECVRGGANLQEFRLKPSSPTRRMVAKCCNTPMVLEFTNGHWVTLYRDRLPASAPPPEMRTMTMDRRAGVELPDDMPNCRTQSASFMWHLLSAWVAMGFRRPKVKGIAA